MVKQATTTADHLAPNVIEELEHIMNEESLECAFEISKRNNVEFVEVSADNRVFCGLLNLS